MTGSRDSGLPDVTDGFARVALPVGFIPAGPLPTCTVFTENDDPPLSVVTVLTVSNEGFCLRPLIQSSSCLIVSFLVSNLSYFIIHHYFHLICQYISRVTNRLRCSHNALPIELTCQARAGLEPATLVSMVEVTEAFNTG